MRLIEKHPDNPIEIFKSAKGFCDYCALPALWICSELQRQYIPNKELKNARNCVGSTDL
jgi:hypothetical protein